MIGKKLSKHLMKSYFAFASILLITTLTHPAPAAAQAPVSRSGIWQGQVGTRRVVLTLRGDSSTLAIPESGQLPARLATLRTPGDSLVASTQYGRAALRARLSNKGQTLSGTLSEYMKTLPVVLRPVAAVQPLRLAQAPKLPLPYRVEEVQFSSAGDSILFGGTLTRPPGQGRVPAVIILSGTGPQTRNGAPSPGGHQPFEVLADYLTRRGFAVLRTDDRGVGRTTGRYDQATTADFAHDALAAVRYLRQRPDIDPNHVGLLGHSEGGAAAMMAAAESPDVAFVVSLAGLLTPGLQALLFQNAELVHAAPIPERDKQRLNELNGLMFRTAYRYAATPDLEAQLRATYQTWKTQDDARLLADKVTNDHFRFPLESYVRQATGPWYRYHVRFDPAPYLAKVRVPVLALNGDRDLLVDYHGLAPVAAALRQAGNRDVTTQVLPGLNHLLQPCRTCLSNEYNDLDITLDPAVLRVVGNWLAQHTR
jgi:pimeloyl-ACP methyl ester carboxylesterase